jgi:hypothetical protein
LYFFERFDCLFKRFSYSASPFFLSFKTTSNVFGVSKQGRADVKVDRAGFEPNWVQTTNIEKAKVRINRPQTNASQ